LVFREKIKKENCRKIKGRERERKVQRRSKNKRDNKNIRERRKRSV
jgi:hypothetical protein